MKRCQVLEGAPPVIMTVLDGGTAISAAHDLFYAWKKAPQAIEAAIGDRTDMSYAEVRALIATALDKPARPPEPAATPEAEPEILLPPAQVATAEDAEPGAVTGRPVGKRGTRAPAPDEFAEEIDAAVFDAPRPTPSRRAPRFTVQAGAREGVLITNRASDTDGHALVQFGETVEDVPVSELRLIVVTALP